jgi:S-layer homology domain
VDTIGTFSSTVHGWDTDFNASPIGYLWTGQTGNALILHVQQGSNPTQQFFGWVEVWWKRSVSPAPGTATFNDVPTSHPFFQFIEALAASGITGGCGSGNYCPDNPVTRGQMAVFLAKALGLHWPGVPPAP